VKVLLLVAGVQKNGANRTPMPEIIRTIGYKKRYLKNIYERDIF